MPASASASLAPRTTRLSTVSASNLPKGVCAHPTMLAVMLVLRKFQKSGGELTTQLVVDVNPNNIVECFFGRREAEFKRPFGVFFVWFVCVFVVVFWFWFVFVLC